MRDPARIHQMVSLLEEYWEKNPDLRLCQVIMNMTSKTNFSMDPYYMEDDLFKKLLEEELAKYNEK